MHIIYIYTYIHTHTQTHTHTHTYIYYISIHVTKLHGSGERDTQTHSVCDIRNVYVYVRILYIYNVCINTLTELSVLFTCVILLALGYTSDDRHPLKTKSSLCSDGRLSELSQASISIYIYIYIYMYICIYALSFPNV